MVENANSVVVELLAKVGSFDQKFDRSAQKFDRSMDRIEGAAGRAERGVRQDMRRIEQQISRSSGQIQSTVRGLATSLGAFFSLREAGELIDSFTRLQNSLQVAGLEGQRLADVQERLRSIGGQYGVEVEALASIFNRAALAQNELGASTEQIIQLNEVVAASLKVTGTSSQEARGALLQLAQALGSGIVRAEEFNSLLEGALPLVQAAARGIDGYGGSVSKLRSAILEGEVTSRQFFEGILAGGTKTIEDAERATLTLGGAFTALRNELSIYIGQAAQTSGANAAIVQGIQRLADNLDTIIPLIANIIALIGVRYVAAAGAATASTIAKAVADVRAAQAATAHAAAQARLNPLMLSGATAATGAAAATSRFAVASGVAATAGRGLLALLGGPVVAAVTVLAGGMLLLAQNSRGAAGEFDNLAASTDNLNKQSDELAQRLKDAGVEVEDLGSAASTTEGQMDGVAGGFTRAARAADDLAQSAERARLAVLRTQLRENQAAQNRIEINNRARSNDRFAGRNRRDFGQEGRDQAAQSLQGQEVALARQIELLEVAIAEGVDALSPEVVSAPAPISTGGGTAKAKGPTGPTAEEIQERANEERLRLAQQELSALASIASSADERAALEQVQVTAAQAAAERQIQNDEDYTAAQKKELLALVQRVADVDRRVIEQRRQEEVEQERLDALEAQADIEEDRLRILEAQARADLESADLSYRLARTAEERREIALRILDLEDRLERAILESVLASETASEADKERARIALRSIEESRPKREQAIAQDNLGPLGSFLDQIPAGAAEINEALEGIAAGGLRTFTDGLTDALVNFTSLKDVGLDVLRSLTQGLVKLAIQQIILKTIGQTAGNAAVAATSAQAAATAAAWAPAAALASLATLGGNAGPAAVALASTTALAGGLAASSGALGLRDGGRVDALGGPRDDTKNVNLSNDEFVVRAKAARAVGYQALDFINRTGELPAIGRADGGPIGVQRPAARAGGSGRGLDEASLARLSQVVREAAGAMPDVNLFPTLDSADAFQAALDNPRGRRAFFQFVQSNSQKLKGMLNQ